MVLVTVWREIQDNASSKLALILITFLCCNELQLSTGHKWTSLYTLMINRQYRLNCAVQEI